MKRALFAATTILACALPSCQDTLPPKGQIVVFIDTDAPVPRAGNGGSTSEDPTLLSPLVDRVRFEVLVDGHLLPGNSRDFEIDDEKLSRRAVSFGIAPTVPNDGGISVRVRLFRADRILSDELPPGVTLDTEVKLPSVSAEGITEVSVVLRVDDFGKHVGPVPATPGRPSGSLVRTWRGGRHVLCTGASNEGDACVPGGAFFLGDPAFRGRTPANDIVDERVVWVSPFFLDRTEVTVGAFRAVWETLAQNGTAAPLAFEPKRNTGRHEDFCTWTDAPTTLGGVAFDALPLNCVSWETARAYCHARGGDLPTEAQLEYVSSGLGEEHAFPWGDDEPDCTSAVWGRGGVGVFQEGSTSCPFAPGPVSWVAFPGTGTRDRLRPLRGGAETPEVLDLGGNLGEWALDMWNDANEPYWSAVLPMADPIAPELGVQGDYRPVRGGAWSFTVLTTRAATRSKRQPMERTSNVGFRCARPAGGG